MGSPEHDMSQSTPADKSEISSWNLLWDIRLSALYHLKRERFLDGVDRAAKAISALSGAAAFAQLSAKAEPVIGMWLTAGVAVVSTLSLVYSLSTKARHHAELARDLKRLEAEMARLGPELQAADLSRLKAAYLEIESGEPAALGALVTQCHNELSASIGEPTHITPLPWHQRVLKNILDFDQSVGRSTEGA